MSDLEVKAFVTLVAGGENTWRSKDGFRLGKVRWCCVYLCHFCTTVEGVECKSGLLRPG
jgi:hypothetical protein